VAVPRHDGTPDKIGDLGQDEQRRLKNKLSVCF
jgi:hypothetical protein